MMKFRKDAIMKTFREKLLREGFKGFYKDEVPVEEKEMFTLLMAINITDVSTHVFAKISSEAEAKHFKKFDLIVEKRKKKLIKKCCYLMNRYIAEIKDLKMNSYSDSFLYFKWYDHMLELYKNDDLWQKNVVEKSKEIGKIINAIITDEFCE